VQSVQSLRLCAEQPQNRGVIPEMEPRWTDPWKEMHFCQTQNTEIWSIHTAKSWKKKNPIPNGWTDEINYGPRAVRLLGQEVDGNEESNPLRMLITMVLDLRVLLRQFHYP